MLLGFSRRIGAALWLLMPVFVTACMPSHMDEPEFLLVSTGNEHATPQQFAVCHGHACRHRDIVGVSQEQWTKVRDHFVPRPINASEERQSIASAIGTIEDIVGEKTGTKVDKGGTFAGTFAKGQLDCEDESLNTTLYLSLLKHRGLLQFHEIGNRARRGMFIDGWPHMTATIVDISSGENYVVDSWFGNNGTPAFITPLPEWREGAGPEKDSS